MKIYTKTGDAGETSLLGGKRVSKNCIEMEAIGEVDELNTHIGVLIALVKKNSAKNTVARLTEIQHCLFALGANLAAVQTNLIAVPAVTQEHVAELETWIDKLEASLVPLTQFILPGGHPAAAESFLARAVCRRAERSVVSLCQRYEDIDPILQKYLNRLSDLLFVLGRWINSMAGAEETVWKK